MLYCRKRQQDKSMNLTASTKKIITVILLTVFGTTSFSYAQNSAEYSARLQKMFQISGSMETYHAAINQMFIGLRQQKSTIPDSIMTAYEKDFHKTSIQELVNMLQPVYEKHLSLADIDEIIQFYESPVGKKFALKTPLITSGSIQAGQQWGMKVAKQFQEKMKAQGY
jgi:hypothetical protein